jgi:hypothetical protein
MRSNGNGLSILILHQINYYLNAKQNDQSNNFPHRPAKRQQHEGG